ncbi:restriction endonuclease subunit S [candidate division NPL-UPA2 bacterium]|nr:restriction endonuclease subunit S [candidate division NPL-UPA2 bacterium]
MKVKTEINSSAIRSPESELPPGWRWVRLGEVCEINPPRPKTFGRSPDASTTFVPMSAVDEKRGAVTRPEVVPYSKVSKGYTYFEENDVLFAKITPCMQNGKHVIAKHLIDGRGFGTTEFHVLRANSEILPEWIHFFIRQPYFLQEATAHFTGAVGQQRVPYSFLSDYLIPLPPIEEQKRIATKLQGLMQEVERARAACEKQLEAAKALPAAYLRQVFESEEAKKWERRRLGEMCEVIMGQSPPGYTYNTEGKGLPFYQGKIEFGEVYLKSPSTWCIQPQKITELNDILISVRAPVGPTNMCNIECCIGRGLTALRPKNSIESWFVFYFLRLIEPEISKTGQGSTFSAISKSQIQNVEIFFPSLLIQQRIAAELKEKMAEVEKLKAAIEKQLDTIKAVPQAILKKAFSGEL